MLDRPRIALASAVSAGALILIASASAWGDPLCQSGFAESALTVRGESPTASDCDVGSGVTLEHYAYSTAAAALRGYRRYADTEVRRARRQRRPSPCNSRRFRRDGRRGSIVCVGANGGVPRIIWRLDGERSVRRLILPGSSLPNGEVLDRDSAISLLTQKWRVYSRLRP